MVAAAVLVGEAAVNHVPCMEGLALEVTGENQSVRDRSCREAPLHLCGEVAAGAAGAVLLNVDQIIPVRRAEQRRSDPGAPRRGVTSGACPNRSEERRVGKAW